MAVLSTGCTTREKDPVEEIKAMIPKVEQHLNRRDLAALKKMGVENLEPNSMVIDVFGRHATDSVRLALIRIEQEADQATLFLDLNSHERPGEQRELHLYIAQDGPWRICSYDIVTTSADTLSADSL